MTRNMTPDNFSGSRPAIFLDRDGTIIEDVGYLDSIDKIQVFPDTVEALRRLQERFVLFVITNQAGVSQGVLTREQVDQVNTHIDKMLRSEGIDIKEWYVCPHSREDNCSCIKPKPEFVLKAASDYGVDLRSSFVIGDHPHDVLTGAELGVFGIYLLTGHGGKHLSELAMDRLVFHRISDAAKWILTHPSQMEDLHCQLKKAAEVIRNGGVAAFPTETVYGLGADVFQPAAVEKIFAIKGRPHYNPLIAHISDINQTSQLVTNFPDKARKLAEAFWPGPLSIVLPKQKEVPDIVTGGHNTVAVRMPAHPIAQELIRLSGTPLAAPSANKFTCTSPTTADHVKNQLEDKCDVIIDGGACRVGVESTVISFTGGTPVVLRPGGVTIEDIEKLIGKVETPAPCPEEVNIVESPGMMPNHYAPATRLSAYNEIPAGFETRSNIGIVLFQPSERTFAGKVEILSKTGDTSEAATNFFAALCRLDSLNLEEIVVEYVPNPGLGSAINNRLAKAAKGRLEHNE